MFSPIISTAFDVNKALEARVRILLEENAGLGGEIDGLRNERSSWQSRVAKAEAEAEKLREVCRVAEAENEALRRYING
jgi:hypothetical protein